MRVFFVWKFSIFDIDLKNAQRNWQKGFCFWGNSVWIGCIKLSLLRTEYLSSAVNVLTDSLKILHVTKRDLFQLIYLHIHQWLWWRWCPWDGIRVSTLLPCCLLRCPLKRDFLDIYLITSFGVRNFGNEYAKRVIFFSKSSKFDVDFEIAQQNSDKPFCFWHKCIWIFCVKLPVLRMEYLSSAVNVLTTNSLKIFDVTTSNSFQLNNLHRDQWI